MEDESVQARWRRLYDSAPLRSGSFCHDVGRSPRTRSTVRPTRSSRASIPTREACTPRCTARSSGRCACSRALARRPTPTSASARSSAPAAPGCRPPLTCRRCSDWTPTTPCRLAKSAAAASPSTPWPTCATSSPASTSATITTSMTINSPAAVMLALFVAQAEEAGVDARATRRHAAERHLEGVPGAKGVRLPAAPLDAPCARHDRLYRGRDAQVELDLGVGLPHPRGRLDGGRGARLHPRQRLRLRRTRTSRRGSSVDEVAPRLSFFFNAHIDFFEEIAKYRAARRLWAKWMREHYRATDEQSWQLRFHTQTAGVSLTAQQPEINIARTAIEALAGVLGGTQSLHTNSMDEALALPRRKRRESRCAPNRSSRTRPTSPTSPIPSAARGSSRS